MESILQAKKECYICGLSATLERHHVFFGTANRKIAEQDGCWVWLCHYHHTGSNKSVHFNIGVDRELKKQAQRVWLNHYNKTVVDFIRRYGRNYDV